MRENQDWKDAFTHLRLHFSLLLMPIFWFALSQVSTIHYSSAIVVFVLLHFLVYPASNIFNSYYDKDQGSVGGLKNPPPTNKKMLWLANILDLLAIAVSFFLKPEAALLFAGYILASRLYSYKPIRLKKYPYLGFLVIFLFQGAFTYWLTLYTCTESVLFSETSSILEALQVNKFALLACSFQIGAIYPLTQIYQHKSDLADGVTTLSYKLGYRGTFVFTGILFTIATFFYFLHFKESDIYSFYLLLIVQIPIILYFLYWARKVWVDIKNANFKHTMQMNVIAAVVLNLFFIYMVINK